MYYVKPELHNAYNFFVILFPQEPTRVRWTMVDAVTCAWPGPTTMFAHAQIRQKSGRAQLSAVVELHLSTQENRVLTLGKFLTNSDYWKYMIEHSWGTCPYKVHAIRVGTYCDLFGNFRMHVLQMYRERWGSWCLFTRFVHNVTCISVNSRLHPSSYSALFDYHHWLLCASVRL